MIIKCKLTEISEICTVPSSAKTLVTDLLLQKYICDGTVAAFRADNLLIIIGRPKLSRAYLIQFLQGPDKSKSQRFARDFSFTSLKTASTVIDERYQNEADNSSLESDQGSKLVPRLRNLSSAQIART